MGFYVGNVPGQRRGLRSIPGGKAESSFFLEFKRTSTQHLGRQGPTIQDAERAAEVVDLGGTP